MSYILDFELPGLPETTNQVLSMRLKNRLNRKMYWKTFVIMTVAAKRPTIPLLRAKLMLIRCSTVRPDPDGLVGSFKHIIDGLVVGGILEDDNYENIGFPIYEWEKTAINAGKIKIRVEEIE